MMHNRSTPPWWHWQFDGAMRPLASYWSDLPLDPYVTSGERRRRYAVARYAGEDLQVLPEEPHVQALKNNPLFGGIERALPAIKPGFLGEPAFRGILQQARRQIPIPTLCWRLQIHQFRIVAPGSPTPEGIHSDGADYVLMVMIQRHHIIGGITSLFGPNDDEQLARFILRRPGQALLLDDRCVRHCVSPITPRIADDATAHRDMLVVTFHVDRSDAGAA